MTFATFTRGLVAAGVLAPFALAQTTTGGVQPLTAAPTYLGIYDMATKTLVPGAPPTGPEIVYDNTADNGFFFQPGAGLINMDAGTFSGGGHNFISSIQIGYGTTTIGDVDVGIRVHEGGAVFGTLGTVVSNFVVTGLPGSVAGEVATFIVDVDLAGASLAFFLNDGPVGYSYELFDSGTGPLLVGPPNEAGVTDAFDQYALDSTLLGTFFFGGPPNPFASFHCQMTGEEEDPNPECFLFMGTGEDFITSPWDVRDVLLVDVLFTMPVTIETMPVFTVPNDPILAGVDLYWQVFMNNPIVFPTDPIQLTNGVKTTLGDPGLPGQYGPDSTMELIPLQPAALGGVIDMTFTIEGL